MNKETWEDKEKMNNKMQYLIQTTLIITLNINGLRLPNKRQIDRDKNQDLSICFLQDTLFKH